MKDSGGRMCSNPNCLLSCDDADERMVLLLWQYPFAFFTREKRVSFYTAAKTQQRQRKRTMSVGLENLSKKVSCSAERAMRGEIS